MARARIWQQYEGHACLFIDGPWQLFLKLSECGDGGCEVVTESLTVDLEPVLLALGLSPGVVPEAIARINLSQEIEFRDRKGIPSVLWHDPKARRILVQPVAADPASERSGSSAIFLRQMRCCVETVAGRRTATDLSALRPYHDAGLIIRGYCKILSGA
jgi:hypothetical protein